MVESLINQHIDDGVATIMLNRPAAHNAINAEMAEMLLASLQELDFNTSIRVVVIRANGQNFCAGIDLNWMQAAAHKKSLELQLADLMYTLYHLSKPTIVLLQGAIYGGGIGLVACCDIVLASRFAHFCFSEVRLGLIPAVISPYVVNAIGHRAARRYLLTAEQFSADKAHSMGLVHEVLEDDQLSSCADELSQQLIAAGPKALARTKRLIEDVAHSKLDNTVIVKSADWLTEVRNSAEAQEGISAFLEKRPALWANIHKE